LDPWLAITPFNSQFTASSKKKQPPDQLNAPVL
jgi:hypothetical protein